jgi:hypothetical protein
MVAEFNVLSVISTNIQEGCCLPEHLCAARNAPWRLGCPVAHIRVAVMCPYLFHITASFDERKGALYTFFACVGHILVVRGDLTFSWNWIV